MENIFAIINAIIVFGSLSMGFYCLILFIKLAKRGIKALDIYIMEKNNK